MGREQRRAAVMTRMGWWLVGTLSGFLEVDERDAVLGDFRDSGETCLHGLRGLLGLITRRQLALWREWQPWLALIGIAGASGVLLSQFVWMFNAPYFGTIGAYFRSVAHWNGHDWMLIPEWRDLTFLLCFAVALSLWSWINGFALASLSGRTIWLTSPVFYLVFLNSFTFTGPTPHPPGVMWAPPADM